MFGHLKSPSGARLVVERYTIEMFLGPNFIPNPPIEEQPGLAEHLLYFAEMTANGFVLIAGPYRAFDGAFVVLSEKVKTYDEAVRIMEDDPWNKMGMSVAVVRILDTNPVPVPKKFKLDAGRPAGGPGGARTTAAGKKRGAARKAKKG